MRSYHFHFFVQNMKQLIVKATSSSFLSCRYGMLNKNEINKTLDIRAIPDHIYIAECMIFPKIKAKGEVEGWDTLFPYFLEV